MTRKQRFLGALIIIFPFLAFFVSLFIGSWHIPPIDILKALLSPVFPSLTRGFADAEGYIATVFSVRLPRLVLAMMVGSSLSVSGAALQALFKNPLVNESILGISSGAAFGASISLVFLGAAVPPQVAAFVFAVGAVLMVLAIARKSDSSIVSLLLTGVITSAFFSALLALVEYFASPYALQALFNWLMGNMTWPGWRELAVALPLMAGGLVILVLMRWRLNALSMTDEEARALGVSVRRDKALVILTATLMTAAATSVAGIIGWVGLLVPHLVRMMVGVDNRRVVPLSAALGAGYLLLADDLARSIAAFELPVGIFTSLIGIPFFIVLLRKSRRLWL
jgi:iron complex transport system permease protein